MKIRFFNTQSLSYKLTIYIVLCSSIITSIMIGLMLYRQYDSDLKKLEQRISYIEVSIVPAIEKSLWEFNDQQVKTLIESLLNLDDIIHVEVHALAWDGETRLIAASRTKPNTTTSVERTFPIVYQASGENTQLGLLVVVASLDSVRSELWKQTRFIIISQGIKTFIITALILLLIHHLLTRHLRSITHQAKSLKITQGYSPFELMRKPPKVPDELDDVLATLNQMQMSLLDEQKKEIELEKQRSYAQANSNAKSEFLSHMSHEIRTPMNGVIGLIDLIDGDNLTEQQKKYLALIRKSSQSLMVIINDILDLSKIEANKLHLVEKEFVLHELLHECTNIYTAITKEKNIKLIENIDGAFQKKLIGDPFRIKQIVLNLLSNAVKYTENGTVEIKAEKIKRSEKDLNPANLYLKLMVKDDGIGIPQQSQQRIFRAFEQGNGNEVSQGTGLGLSICKKLVHLMGGEIGLNSTPAAGSEFWVLIPLIESRRWIHEPGETQDSFLPAFDFSAIAHNSVLVVEDNEINQQVIESLLNKLGVYPVILGNGVEVIEHLQTGVHYPIILMDCEMPIMNGFETLQQIRAQGLNENSRIISLSAYTDKKHIERCRDAGMDYSLSKPVSIQDLQKTLAKVLEVYNPASSILTNEPAVFGNKKECD